MGSTGPNMDYISINRENWDDRAAALKIIPSSHNLLTYCKHAKSRMYSVDTFAKDPSYTSHIVRYDTPLRPDIKGKHVIHLQGHIGTDSLSLVRLGAASVTILDFSAASLEQAKRLAETCKESGGDKLRFIEASVYDALDESLYGANDPKPGDFDVVFTGVGSLCWLHSIAQWGAVVGKLLKPGGWFFIRDDHPMMNSVGDDPRASEKEGELSLEYAYFEDAENYAILESAETYADTDEAGPLKSTRTVQFNHGLGEIVQSIIDAGLRVTTLKEHQEVPFAALGDRMESVDVGTGKEAEWRLKSRPSRCPATFTLVAWKD